MSRDYADFDGDKQATRDKRATAKKKSKASKADKTKSFSLSPSS